MGNKQGTAWLPGGASLDSNSYNPNRKLSKTSDLRLRKLVKMVSSVQSLSRVQLCNPMNCSTPGFPVHHQLPEFTQTHVHWVSDAIQPSRSLSAPSPPSFNLSQHQGLFQWVSSLFASGGQWSCKELDRTKQLSQLEFYKSYSGVTFCVVFFSFFFSFLKYLLTWLCEVLVVACRIFSCGMWHLVSWPGIKPVLERGGLASGPPGKSLYR